ncbi:hypothetical protein GCM10010517_39670 [Streptosporangium fragile]|uniref:Uncharacterized protein n=1 Tax=Streptosporangium fragile TaxID=46186 RepID=A0ABP6IFF1_9ACTN
MTSPLARRGRGGGLGHRLRGRDRRLGRRRVAWRAGDPGEWSLKNRPVGSVTGFDGIGLDEPAGWTPATVVEE